MIPSVLEVCMGIQPTASKTDLLLHCVRPFALDTPIEKDEPGEAAIYGTAFHDALYHKIFHPPVPPSNIDVTQTHNVNEQVCRYPTPDADINKHVEEAFSVLHNWLEGNNPFNERFNILSGEISLTTDPHKKRGTRISTLDKETHVYDMATGEIGGTYDLLVIGVDSGRKCVIDYKTGVYGNFTIPSTIPQLLTLALQTSSTLVAILHCPLGIPPAMYVDEIDPRTIEKHRQSLARQLDRVGDGSLTPGSWCKYCPAKRDCIANDVSLLRSATSLVRKVTDSPPLTHDKTPDLGMLHLMLGELDRLAKRARDEIRERVRAGEYIERPDGKHLQLVKKQYERLSKTSILEALGKQKGEELLDKLRGLGCLTVDEREEMWAK